MMASKNTNYTGDLSPASIDSMSESLNQLLHTMNISSKEIVKLRICVEAVMEIWAKELGENTKCQLLKVQRLGQTYLFVQAEGKSVDPTAFQDELLLSVSNNPNIAVALGLPAEYRYSGGQNILKLRLPGKPISSITQVFIAMAAAIVAGLGMRELVPEMGSALADQFIEPLMVTITDCLRLISGPLVFLSIVSGINGLGDASALGKIGVTMVKRFFTMTLAITFAVWLSVCWLFPMTLSSVTAGESAFEKVFSMILDIVPSDIISPFQTGNALQIIFLAGCVGVGIILMGDSVAEVANMLNQINAVVQLLMAGISKLLPAYIFLCIYNLILTSEPSELVQLFVPLVLNLVLCIVVTLVYGCYAALKSGISPIHLFSSQLSTLLICLTTASSAAAFSTNVECCEKKLGINEKLIRFGVPFGQVLFMPGAAILFTILPLYMAKQNSIPITPAWLITLLLISTILAMAAPPIPGGSLSCTMILFSQLGVPTSCIALCAAILPFTEYSATACNVGCLQQELMICAKKLGLERGSSRCKS